MTIIVIVVDAHRIDPTQMALTVYLVICQSTGAIQQKHAYHVRPNNSTT